MREGSEQKIAAGASSGLHRHDVDFLPHHEQAEDIAALFEEWQRTRDPVVRDQIIEKHMNLVHYLARKFRDRGESVEDLVQQGLIGLINAFDRYDPSRGVRFTTYATTMILGEIKRYFRDKTHTIKVPRRVQEFSLRVRKEIDHLAQTFERSPTIHEIAEAMDASDENVVEALESSYSHELMSLEKEQVTHGGAIDSFLLQDRMGGLDEAVEMVGVRAHIEEALKTLSPREQTVIRLLFFHGLSQSDIAKEIGVSQMQVSRIKHHAMIRLRRFLSGEQE